jgi:NAD(P)H-hydrate epimerase
MAGGLILSRDQLRRVDALAQSRYGITSLVLMENAGRGASEAIDRGYGPRGTALVACGTGNNGGDGLVIARHLNVAGWTVRVLIAGDPAAMSADCAANDRIVLAMNLPRFVSPDGAWPADLATDERTIVVDALLGTGFSGALRPAMRMHIENLNACPKRAMVAVDVPSGMDCDTGEPAGAAIQADRTITFVAAKPGFETPTGGRLVGECEVVGIGVPPELIAAVSAAGTKGFAGR